MHVLLATAGSIISQDAIKFGAQFSSPSDPGITIMTVIGAESDRDHGEAALESARELLSPDFSNIHLKIRVGQLPDEILKEAKEGRYELIVLGASTRGGFTKRLLKGSSLLSIVENAPCPVLIVKGRHRSICKILLCDSGVEDSSLPGCFAVLYADLSEHEEEITILHVMSQISAGPGITGRQLRAGAEDLILENAPERHVLERNIEILSQPLIHPHPKIRHGFVVDEILAEAKDGDYDLVIIGAHRREGWRGILLDDLARKIILQIDRSILVVP
jgi:nucleotide-binding universal stress UspA family protein